MSQVPQQKQRKFYPCRRNCGTQVTFENAHKNPDGSKFVPLIVNSVGQLEAHQCPNRKQPQQQQAHQASPTPSSSSPTPTTTPLQVKQQQPQSRPNDGNNINAEVIALLQRAIQLLEEARNQK